MGCGCGSSVKESLRDKEVDDFIPSKKSYTILNVIFDEIFNRAKKVSRYRRTKRLLSCFSCDKLFTRTMQCKKCGCFVNAKVVYEKSSCPIDRW